MLQSIWKLLHEKELLLSPKKNVKKLKEPLVRIINMLQFAYHAAIVTPEDDEQESDEDKAMRDLTKRQVRSLVNPLIFSSALTPPEETALASFLIETLNKLSPPQKIDEDATSGEESEEDEVIDDTPNPLNNQPKTDDKDQPQDNKDNQQPSNSHVFIQGSQKSAADILSRTDPKSKVTVDQLLNMHMDSLALFQDVIKTNGQVRQHTKEIISEIYIKSI